MLPVHATADGVLCGQGFAVVPLTADIMRFLLGRCAKFREARHAYPEMYATSEFDYTCTFHDTGDEDAYESGDRELIEALAEDDELMDAVAGSGDNEKLRTIDATRLPEWGIRTDCDCLNISGWTIASRSICGGRRTARTPTSSCEPPRSGATSSSGGWPRSRPQFENAHVPKYRPSKPGERRWDSAAGVIPRRIVAAR
jgi:hypothetical protein